VLYNMLVKPAQVAVGRANKVLIIADGCLHKINFETLVIDAPIRHYC